MMLDSRFFNPHPQRNQIFAPAAPLPLPVLVVTGFLGSGKTTLVKQSPGLVRHFFGTGMYRVTWFLLQPWDAVQRFLSPRLMKRRGNLRLAAVAHDLADTVNVDAAFLSSVAEVQRGHGFQDVSMKLERGGGFSKLFSLSSQRSWQGGIPFSANYGRMP